MKHGSSKLARDAMTCDPHIVYMTSVDDGGTGAQDWCTAEAKELLHPPAALRAFSSVG